jgi:hypothetical protein
MPKAEEPLVGSAIHAARADVLRHITSSLDLRVASNASGPTPFVTGASGQEHPWKNMTDDCTHNELVDRSIVHASRALKADVAQKKAAGKAAASFDVAPKTQSLAANWQPPWWLEESKRKLNCACIRTSQSIEPRHVRRSWRVFDVTSRSLAQGAGGYDPRCRLQTGSRISAHNAAQLLAPRSGGGGRGGGEPSFACEASFSECSSNAIFEPVQCV